MPWPHLRNLTLDDLEAIFTYIQSVQLHQPAGLTTAKISEDASYYCAADADCDKLDGGTSGIETCDLTAASPTYQECIGRSCGVDSDCRACQMCNVGTSTCGGAVVMTCVTSGI